MTKGQGLPREVENKIHKVSKHLSALQRVNWMNQGGVGGGGRVRKN